MLFFTFDTHFNDSKIIKQYGRAFTDVESMNTTLISNWNTVISPKFVIIEYHDFFNEGKIYHHYPSLLQIRFSHITLTL